MGILNVDRIKGKKPDVQNLLVRKRTGCLVAQETVLLATEWDIRMPGYHCFSVCGEKGAFIRRVAVLLKNTLNGRVVGKSSPWHVGVRCFGGSLAQTWIIVSVYILSGRRAGAQDIAKLQQDIRIIRAEYPIDSIMIMRDWNRTFSKLALS